MRYSHAPGPAAELYAGVGPPCVEDSLCSASDDDHVTYVHRVGGQDDRTENGRQVAADRSLP